MKVFELISLVSDLSPEAASMLLAVVIGGYTLIGGLGATFYVSYFNTMLIFIKGEPKKTTQNGFFGLLLRKSI